MTLPVLPATDAELSELRAGLDGVTNGPWRSADDRGRGNNLLRIINDDGRVRLSIASITARIDATANAAHIARCSPDRMARLLARLDAAERRIPAEQPVAYGYSAEIQSGHGKQLTVSREQIEPYDTPLYASPTIPAEQPVPAISEEMVDSAARVIARSPLLNCTLPAASWHGLARAALTAALAPRAPGGDTMPVYPAANSLHYPPDEFIAGMEAAGIPITEAELTEKRLRLLPPRPRPPLVWDGDVAPAGEAAWRTVFNEMLAALKAALNMVDGDGMPPNWDLLRSIVAKAEATGADHDVG